MQHPTIPFGECEAVTAAGGLVVSSINRNTGIMTEQKRANGTVANEDHIAGSVSGQDVFDLPNNAQLGIDGALPAPNTGKWLREKLICHGLEFAGHQETCRRSVVLVHRLPHLDADVQFRSMISAVSIAFRSPLEMTCVVPDSFPEFANASVRAFPTSLRPHDGTGAPGSILT